MEIFGIILTLVYIYAGDKANYYLKYHLLGVRAEVYGDTGNYITSRFIWARFSAGRQFQSPCFITC